MIQENCYAGEIQSSFPHRSGTLARVKRFSCRLWSSFSLSFLSEFYRKKSLILVNFRQVLSLLQEQRMRVLYYFATLSVLYFSVSYDNTHYYTFFTHQIPDFAQFPTLTHINGKFPSSLMYNALRHCIGPARLFNTVFLCCTICACSSISAVVQDIAEKGWYTRRKPTVYCSHLVLLPAS